LGGTRLQTKRLPLVSGGWGTSGRPRILGKDRETNRRRKGGTEEGKKASKKMEAKASIQKAKKERREKCKAPAWQKGEEATKKNSGRINKVGKMTCFEKRVQARREEEKGN